MSDKEEGSTHSSPAGSYREKSTAASEGEKAPSSTGSIRESRSRSKSKSRSRSKSKESHKSPSRTSPSRRRSGSRSRSRSRSYRRSRSRSRGKRRYSRSHSRSPRRYRSRHSPRRSRYRSHSRSPMSSRRRHVGSREAPRVTNCVGVFGLSLYTTERDVRDFFGRYGPIDEIQVVHDHQTGRSRGFGFIYYHNRADAQEARDRAPGTEIDGRKIRVDYSITERAHTPTPGIYLGKPTPASRRTFYRDDRKGGGSGGGGGGGGGGGERGGGERGGGYRGYSRRSPSPYYNRRRYSRSRSRSRSYSPRKYSSRYGPYY